jgi:hypothetical protein
VAVAHSYSPAGFVDHDVVGQAKQDQIIEIGGSAVGLMCDVVRGAPVGTLATAGMRTAAVAGGERGALGRAGGAAGAAEVERDAVAAEDGGGDAGVAQDPP